MSETDTASAALVDEEPVPTSSDVEPLLAVDGLELRAGQRLLVRDLCFELSPGERLVIVGGNGTGKSTLMAVLAGLAEPAAGTVRRPATPPGMLFQDGALWPHMTVAQHLDFADPHGNHAWRRKLLEVYRLNALVEHRPEALSGGERLRLGLARALAARPKWLLLDEPLAHLDPEVAAAVRDTLPVLVAELGAAMLTVTHDPDDVLLFGERLLALTGHGPWWLGPSRYAIESPPTSALATFSDRGTVVSGWADDDGHVDLGLGLSLDGCSPGREARAFLDASAVHVAPGRPGTVLGTYVAPDRRGGSWLRVEGRLLRSRDGAPGLSPGDAVGVHIEGVARALPDDDRTTPA